MIYAFVLYNNKLFIINTQSTIIYHLLLKCRRASGLFVVVLKNVNISNVFHVKELTRRLSVSLKIQNVKFSLLSFLKL